MLCLVTQPNGFIIEISLDNRARGQQCLDKVCEELSIIEVDFFGLQYENKNGYLYWLNLRNPIRQQSNSERIRLYLKVKFYCPPYLISQDSTRHQFYLNIKKSLKEHQLKVSNITKRAKLIALISQAELGNYKEDSFDLKQLYSEWILILMFNNHRNQKSAIETNTRKRRKHSSGSSLSEDEVNEDSCEEFCSQSDDDSNSKSQRFINNSRFNTIDRLTNKHSEFYLSIIEFHRQFSGYLSSKAENDFLEEAAELDDIGIDYFAARTEADNEKCKIGVGTRGVIIQKSNKKMINYSALIKVRTSTHFFTLKFIDDNSEVKERKFQLSSTKLANALYRVVTEKHVFYSCDSVTDSVATQCILGFTGMFWSIAPAIFKDDPQMGKNFVFDIRRTLRQFYDDVQRTMFKMKARLDRNLILDQTELANHDSTEKLNIVGESTELSVAENGEKLLCRICYDRQVRAAFVPCGHVICCEQCSSCDICPVCRVPIESRLKIYF